MCLKGTLLPIRGTKGVAFTDALDRRDMCPSIPEYGTPEYDSNALDKLHASIPALLSAAAAQEVQEVVEAPEAQLVSCTLVERRDACIMMGLSESTLDATFNTLKS